MSVDNSELLMLLGGKKKAKQTIGIAGQQGFGVGVYGGDPADLKAMGLKPMSGCFNPTSDNYGNYIHTNGSVMVFIPAFCFRVGNKNAPSYSRDAENAIEIRDASEGEDSEWRIHRAFIDGGSKKLGFFIDKYLCSKDSSGETAVSVKNADNIFLSGASDGSGSMPGCSGSNFDGITLGRSRGEQYSCTTAFQWAAISMLSLAHGQATNDNQFCAWFDGSYVKNYPRGINNSSLGDDNDTSVSWVANSNRPTVGKTGSGSPFNKTTHNGQNCGVTNVNGYPMQLVIGFYASRYDNDAYYFYGSGLRQDIKAHFVTKDSVEYGTDWSTGSVINLYDNPQIITRFIENKSGWARYAFRGYNSSGYSLCGVLPLEGLYPGIPLFENSPVVFNTSNVKNCLAVGYKAWYRNMMGWLYSSTTLAFRISGYAN